MQLNKPAVDRLRQASLRAEAICTVYEHMLQCAQQFGVVATELRLDYQSPDDPPAAEGDFIPVITLSLRPATKKQQEQDQGNVRAASDLREGTATE